MTQARSRPIQYLLHTGSLISARCPHEARDAHCFRTSPLPTRCAQFTSSYNVLLCTIVDWMTIVDTALATAIAKRANAVCVVRL